MASRNSAHGLMARARRSSRALLVAVLVAAALLVPGAPSHAATILNVDRNNPSCSDSGSGTSSVPYCTIGAANARALAGTTVRVASGTYNEQITVQNAGTAAAPIVFEPAPGANVTLTSPGHGFVNYGKDWITIRGFNITSTVGYGIYLYYVSNNLVSDNHVSFSGRPVAGQTSVGMFIKGATDSLIVGNVTDHNSDAGIYLTTDTTRVTVRNNTSFANARGYVAAAPGIDVRAPGNTIDANTVYSNEDSGIQIYSGSADTVVTDNVVYDNGDYGVDVSNAGSATIVGNSVFRNRKSGINVEGGSSGSRLANNLSVDNGLDASVSKGNISVDSQSVPGTSVDYDLVYLSSAGRMVTWGGTIYTSLAAFAAATGQEAHGIESNPGWVAPTSGDFHLTLGSAAIDSADSGSPSHSSTDRDGKARVDNPTTPNTGSGPRSYDDRGAYEFQLLPSTDSPPTAALTVTPTSGTVPLSVTADASASTDPDATSPIASYAFDFGDGTLVGPQSGATATHSFASAGAYTVTVTVRDTKGLSDTASVQVTAGARVNDEVHYTFTGPTSVALDWRGPDAEVRYGTTSAYGSTVVGHTPSPAPFSSPGPFLEAQLTGLARGTTYHYSIGGGVDRTFRTPPTGGFRFDAIGDVGDSGNYRGVAPTQGQIAADDPAFVLMLGDLTYGNDHGPQAVDRHFNDMMEWSDTAAYMPAWGNHEWEAPASDDLRNYKGRFAIPNGAAAAGAPAPGCCGEDWGWFDAGNVRFISYPEPYSGQTWSDWRSHVAPIMTDAQSDPGISFIVTFGHRPAYSTGHHNGETALAAQLDNLGDQFSKYVLNLNGHSHDYERFSPIHGVTHVTVAGGGATLEPPWGSTDPRTAYRAMHLVHARIDATASSLHLEAVCGPATSDDDITCNQGQVIDSVTISNQGSPPVAALTVTPASGPVPLEVTANGSGSVGGDAPISSYTFDFGDGTVVGPQAGATATHTYSTGGTYTAAVTVRNTAGRSDTASVQVTATTTAANLVGNPGFEVNTNGWAPSSGAAITLARVAGGHTGGWAAQIANSGTAVSASCTLNDSPNWALTTQAGTYRGSLWVRAPSPGATLKLKFREYQGSTLVGSQVASVTLATTWKQLQLSYSPVAPGSSTLDFVAYTSDAPSGVCFQADDATITRT
jgi:parallel beta-helix repeat protein